MERGSVGGPQLSAGVAVGVIGGSGVYDLDALQDRESVRMDTPYGPPSDEIVVGKLGEVRAAFLPRHG